MLFPRSNQPRNFFISYTLAELSCAPCNFANLRGFELSTRPQSLGKNERGDMRRRIIGLLCFAVLGSAFALGADRRDVRRDLRHDRIDRRADRRDIRSDRRDLRRDRHKLRRDLRNGNYRAARRERRDIRGDRRDLRRDHRDLRSDRRNSRHDRRDFRKSVR
jgi:hypothetical protein